MFPIAERKIITIIGEPDHYNLERDVYLPIGKHPGCFGYARKHHIHEGIDLYCEPGTPVYVTEDSEFLSYFPFTGEHAGSPWWQNTWAAVIKLKNSYLVYGEILPTGMNLPAGYPLKEGDILGVVIPVLCKDKGRPTSMLHVELYKEFNGEFFEWSINKEKDPNLLDPTHYLMSLIK